VPVIASPLRLRASARAQPPTRPLDRRVNARVAPRGIRRPTPPTRPPCRSLPPKASRPFPDQRRVAADRSLPAPLTGSRHDFTMSSHSSGSARLRVWAPVRRHLLDEPPMTARSNSPPAHTRHPWRGSLRRVDRGAGRSSRAGRTSRRSHGSGPPPAAVGSRLAPQVSGTRSPADSGVGHQSAGAGHEVSPPRPGWCQLPRSARSGVGRERFDRSKSPNHRDASRRLWATHARARF